MKAVPLCFRVKTKLFLSVAIGAVCIEPISFGCYQFCDTRTKIIVYTLHMIYASPLYRIPFFISNADLIELITFYLLFRLICVGSVFYLLFFYTASEYEIHIDVVGRGGGGDFSFRPTSHLRQCR